MFKYVIVKCILLISVKGLKESNFAKDRCEGLDELRSQIDCKFNPDDYLDVPQIIKRHGYPSESHVCVTDDGYLLKLHRIPGTKNGKQGDQPVLLQHGLLGSSADWILNGNNSLGNNTNLI